MELLFYSLAGIIVIVVIAVSRKSIVAGMEARSDIKRENKPSNNEEGIEDIKTFQYWMQIIYQEN